MLGWLDVRRVGRCRTGQTAAAEHAWFVVSATSPTSWSSARERPACAPRSPPTRPAAKWWWSASVAVTTPTRSWPPGGSTPPSAPSTPTPGGSTTPTRCGRATSWPTRGWWSCWPGRPGACWSWPIRAPFARLPDGRLDQRFFGAHRWRRTCYAGDWTGRAILRALTAKVAELGISVIDDQYVSQLLVADGTCFGALAFDLESGERTVFLADAVVLAAGGHRIWRRSSSRRDENTGDGMYLALRAGCRLADMELVQFHPTGMVAPEEAAGTLVTEAVRGEGGQLKNALGERFMARYDPERMELSTRDRVALANYTEIAEGGGPNGGVFLDITHLGKDAILEAATHVSAVP